MFKAARLLPVRNLVRYQNLFKIIPKNTKRSPFCTRGPPKPAITAKSAAEIPEIRYGNSNRLLPGQVREKSSKCSPACSCGPKRSKKKKSGGKSSSRCGKSKRKLPGGGKQGKSAMWRKFSLAVVPLILLFSVFIFSSIGPHERPPFIKYEYMRKRDKRFAWGDGEKTFFHNPHVNALPDGYEDEIEKRALEEQQKAEAEELKKNKGKKKVE